MLCSRCGADTKVVKTETAAHGREVRRHRACTSDPLHRFQTVERRTGTSLSAVGVRRSGDRLLAKGGFDRDRFVRDVQNGVLTFLDEAEVGLICTQVMENLTHKLPAIMSSLRDDELAVHHGLTGWIWDTEITHSVEQRLRIHRQRVAQVMYALSIRGRADRSGREGWRHAGDVLGWIFQQYPDLAVSFARTARPQVDVDIWYPASAAPEPATVVKRNKARRRPFLRTQFDASIRRAMLGRPAADIKTDHIAQWVLWGVAGQTSVHTSQLAIGVLDCLRRVDDIAYLRWAAVTKGIESVTEFRDEALALISHPSTRLKFDIQARPRRPDHRRIPPASTPD